MNQHQGCHFQVNKATVNVISCNYLKSNTLKNKYRDKHQFLEVIRASHLTYQVLKIPNNLILVTLLR